jgi:hypothetical protein
MLVPNPLNLRLLAPAGLYRRRKSTVRTEKGQRLPQTGIILPVAADDPSSMRPYAEALAAALRTELGDTRSAAKTVMRWTGAGERTVKTWLGGVSGPNGEHLIRLICHSDVVFALVLARSGRARADVWDANARARRHILQALAALRDATSGAGMPEGD